MINLGNIQAVKQDEHQGRWRPFELRANGLPIAVCCTPALFRLTNSSSFQATAYGKLRTLPRPDMELTEIAFDITLTTAIKSTSLFYTYLVYTGDRAGIAVSLATWHSFIDARRRTKRGEGPWRVGPANFRFDLFIPGTV
jgi:hypothetical protein